MCKCAKCGIELDTPYSYLNNKAFCSARCKKEYVARTAETKKFNENQRAQAKKRKLTVSDYARIHLQEKGKIKVRKKGGGKGADFGKKLRKLFKMK